MDIRDCRGPPLAEVGIDTPELETWLNKQSPNQKAITHTFQIPLRENGEIEKEKKEKRQTWSLIIHTCMNMCVCIRAHAYISRPSGLCFSIK